MNEEIKNILNTNGNNTFTFCGESLSGKSVEMKKKYRELLSSNSNEFNFIALPIIDPSIHKQSATLIEIVLGNMFSYFKAHLSDFDFNDDKRRKLTHLFQETFSSLQQLKGVKNDDSLEMLMNLSNGTQSQEKVDNLLKTFIEFFGVKNKRNILLLALDECNYYYDHKNLLDDINHFLINEDILILLSFDVKNLNAPSYLISKVLPISRRKYLDFKI